MDFAFYNEVGSRSAAGQVLVPVRRLARRLMRPVAYRLRDLLQYLYDQQAELRRDFAGAEAGQRVALDALRGEVAALRAETAVLRVGADMLRAEIAGLAEQARRSRPLHSDYRGLAHRLDRVEDAVQQLHGGATEATPARPPHD